METILKIKVFLSSPTDVLKDRDAIEEVINEINQGEGLRKKYVVSLYRWEKMFEPGLGTYQEQINHELDDTDIYVGLLWDRFGSPTVRYSSGTEEEFNYVYDLIKTGKKIEFCFYRCKRKPGKIRVDEEQRLKVEHFLKKTDNNIFSSVSYTSTRNFKKTFRKNISSKIEKVLEQRKNGGGQFNGFSDNLLINGISKFYTPGRNSERNSDKIDFLDYEKSDIFLLAHSGNSYLNSSEDGNPARFYDSFKNRLLKMPYKAKVLLLNPYSLEARKIFYAENFNSYRNDITSIKDIAQLKTGKNFRRFQSCIKGIDIIKQELCAEKDKIEVRISNVATDGTILMSENRLFFEPYISSRFLTRIEKGLNIFEVQVNNLLHRKQCFEVYNPVKCRSCEDREKCSNNLYKTIAEQFHILWATSISLAEYRGLEHKYSEDFLLNQPDLFNKQIVQLHDSWFAFDPVIGCRGNCVYCFLGPQGWKNSKPELRKRPHEDDEKFLNKSFESLIDYKFLKKQAQQSKELGKVPVSIGNKTDMFSKDNLKNLTSILDLHEKSKEKKRPVVLITKQLIDSGFLEKLGRYSFGINIFYSLSFLSREFEPNIPTYQQRMKSARLNRKLITDSRIRNIKLIHYWRPIIGLTEESIDSIIDQVKEVFDCSVCIGLKINDDILNFIETAAPTLFDYLNMKKNNSELINEVELIDPPFSGLQEIAIAKGHPIFNHTSCAISFLQGKADYNGSMWRKNFCDKCIKQQQDRCQNFRANWNVTLYKSKLDAYLSSYNNLGDCIEIIDTSITQEEMNFLTHLFGKPIFSKSIRFSLVWPSSNQLYYHNKYVPTK